MESGVQVCVKGWEAAGPLDSRRRVASGLVVELDVCA